MRRRQAGQGQAVAVVQPAAMPAELQETVERARQFFDAAKSAATRRAYAADQRHFGAWAARRGLPALPAAPETLALYLADMAKDFKRSTISRRLAAIGEQHREAGHDSPTEHPLVRRVAKGIRRELAAPPVKRAPATVEVLRSMVEALPDTLAGRRDRALLLLGFAGAFRRSELVGLDVDDLEAVRDGLVVTLRRSKTDQEGRGAAIGIPYGSNPATCPVRAVQDWIAAAGLKAGPLFRAVSRHGRLADGRLCDRAVALIVKRCLPEGEAARFSGHSLRRGLMTSAAGKVALPDLMRQSRHKSVAVAMGYVERASLFDANPAAAVGL